MTDRLTQLQDAVDQLATQCFSALRYISDHHNALPTSTGEALANDVDAGRSVDTPETFEGMYSLSSKQEEVATSRC